MSGLSKDTISSGDAGSPDGVASLDGSALHPLSEVSPRARIDFKVVADATARLALTVEEGDEAKQTDDGSYWIYDGTSWHARPDGSVSVHDLGGAQHATDTLANLNTKVSDGTLIDTNDVRLSDARAPTSHEVAGSAHTASTLSNLNSKINDATLDDASASRTPSSHGLGGSEHAAATLAELNAKVSDATLIDTSDTRISTQAENDALGGTSGVPSTTNRYVTDVDTRNSDSRTPTSHASTHQHGGGDEVATPTSGANAVPKAGAGGKLADGWVSESSVTQHVAAIDHDGLTNFAVAEHRPINDSGSSTTELWSAAKISSEVAAAGGGIDFKDSVETVADTNITLSGEQTLNGVLTSNSRVGVIGQSTASENGIYVSASGAWTRSADADQDAEVSQGMTFFVADGSSTKIGFQYIITTDDPITVGTTALSFAEVPRVELGTTPGTATAGNDARVPTQDENDALVGTNGTPSTSNRYVTNSDPRNSDNRTDANAIHDNAAGEIAALTEKGSPVGADIVVIEDSVDSNNKKKVQLTNLPGGGGLVTKSGVALAAAFSGNPKKATISFGAAFADANYSPSIIPDGSQFSPYVENVTASGFDINMGSNNITGLISVLWIAIKHGET